MNEITLGQTVLRAAFGGDCLKHDGRKRPHSGLFATNIRIDCLKFDGRKRPHSGLFATNIRIDCLKFDGKKSREIRERKMSRISDTGTLRPMHGTQSGCFCSANVSSPAPVKAVCSVQSGYFCSANIQLCDGRICPCN